MMIEPIYQTYKDIKEKKKSKEKIKIKNIEKLITLLEEEIYKLQNDK